MAGTSFTRTVLIVADKAATRADVAAAWTPAEAHTVRRVATVGEALEALRDPDATIDGILIDLDLPSSGAVTLTRAIRNPPGPGRRDIPIIMFGGTLRSPQFMAASRLGIQGHLNLPIDHPALRVMIGKGKPATPAAPDRPAVSGPAPSGPAVSGTIKPFRHHDSTIRLAAAPPSLDDGFGLEAPWSPPARHAKRRPPSLPLGYRLLAVG